MPFVGEGVVRLHRGFTRKDAMEQQLWIMWLAIAVLLIVAEIFTLGFVLFWFGIGALAAALVGMTGVGFIWQFAAFAIVSTALTVMSRTIFSRYLLSGDSVKFKTGIESLPGQVGTVASPSKGALREGAVRVYGSVWTAFPADGESELEEGERVEVVEVRGSSIYVKKMREELPGWKQE
ncbi:MAG TPA: hypothetical protein DEA22_10010 [Blastocatellia bacterium]|nr:hypothetical protein [Blastocatellia bacterium]